MDNITKIHTTRLRMVSEPTKYILVYRTGNPLEYLTLATLMQSPKPVLCHLNMVTPYSRVTVLLEQFSTKIKLVVVEGVAVITF